MSITRQEQIGQLLKLVHGLETIVYGKPTPLADNTLEGMNACVHCSLTTLRQYVAKSSAEYGLKEMKIYPETPKFSGIADPERVDYEAIWGLGNQLDVPEAKILETQANYDLAQKVLGATKERLVRWKQKKEEAKLGYRVGTGKEFLDAFEGELSHLANIMKVDTQIEGRIMPQRKRIEIKLEKMLSAVITLKTNSGQNTQTNTGFPRDIAINDRWMYFSMQKIIDQTMEKPEEFPDVSQDKSTIVINQADKPNLTSDYKTLIAAAQTLHPYMQSLYFNHEATERERAGKRNTSSPND